jgi:hypothetical protein
MTDEAKIKKALHDADMSCEGANYHDRVGLAEIVFKAIKKYIPQPDHVKAAQALAKAIKP